MKNIFLVLKTNYLTLRNQLQVNCAADILYHSNEKSQRKNAALPERSQAKRPKKIIKVRTFSATHCIWNP